MSLSLTWVCSHSSLALVDGSRSFKFMVWHIVHILNNKNGVWPSENLAVSDVSLGTSSAEKWTKQNRSPQNALGAEPHMPLGMREALQREDGDCDQGRMAATNARGFWVQTCSICSFESPWLFTTKTKSRPESFRLSNLPLPCFFTAFLTHHN